MPWLGRSGGLGASPRVVDTRPARLCLAEGVPMGQQRRRFSPEFKADAVALVRSSGRPIAAIARELGIGESNLSYSAPWSQVSDRRNCCGMAVMAAAIASGQLLRRGRRGPDRS
jgi:hypothetical protein